MPGLEQALQMFGEEAADGLSSHGSQLFVASGTDVLADTSFGVDGFGNPMTSTAQHRIYCAGKPLAALAVGRLVDHGELSWNDRLADVIDQELPDGISRLSIEEVLRHRGGLIRIRGIDMIAMPTELRTALVLDADVAPGLESTAAYSEFSGWHLLGLAIRDLTGRAAAEYVNDSILSPLGLDREIRIGLRTRDEPPPLPNVDLTELKPVPMLLSSTYESCWHRELADQAITSARGLGLLYVALGQILANPSEDWPLSTSTLRYMLTPGATAFDPSMGRECSYGCGFMTKLREHRFGDLCSPDSFGHSGYRGVTFGFHDPEGGISIAVHENAVLDAETAIDFRRARRVDSLLRALRAR